MNNGRTNNKEKIVLVSSNNSDIKLTPKIQQNEVIMKDPVYVIRLLPLSNMEIEAPIGHMKNIKKARRL